MTGFNDHLTKGLRRQRSMLYHIFKEVSFKANIPEGLGTRICSDIWHSHGATLLVRYPETLAASHGYLVSHVFCGLDCFFG